jgi:hypothetical protein
MGEPDTDGALMKSADTATTTTTGRGRLSDLDKFGRRKLYWLGLTIVAIVFFATLPLYYDVANGELGILFFMVFIYGVVAQGWNLVAGYTGQISLGQNAFFGLGAFTTALLWFWNITHTGYWFDPVLMVLSLIVPAIVAILIGLPLLSRLRGDYFAFGTLGLGVIVKVLFLNGGNITGGSEGKLLIKVLPENVVFDLRTHYYVGLLVAIIATAVVYVMTSSRIGLALKAIREDEVSAASHGIGRACGQCLYLLPASSDADERVRHGLAFHTDNHGGARGDRDDSWSLARRTYRLCHHLVWRKVLPGLASGDPGRPHDPGHALPAIWPDGGWREHQPLGV